MTDIVDYYLNSASNIVQYETIEITHANFTQTHLFVRNNTNGLTAFIEGAVSTDFVYVPMKITENGSSADLDYGLTIEFGDLGEDLPLELDAIVTADGLFTEPVLTYRTFRSDNLTEPMLGPIQLKIKAFAFDKYGAVFEAVADRANSQKTGELYTISRFPMLKAFL